METQAADQVINISLKGVEYALVLSGKAAVRIAALLMAMAKWVGQHEKSRGAMRLGSMLRSGKELTVFSVPEQSMREFTREARRYGITYCALRDKQVKDGVVDLLVRSEDAPKINRIVERYNMLPVDARVAAEGHSAPGREPQQEPVQPEQKQEGNPTLGRAGQDRSQKPPQNQPQTGRPSTRKKSRSKRGSVSLAGEKKTQPQWEVPERPSVVQQMRSIAERTGYTPQTSKLDRDKLDQVIRDGPPKDARAVPVPKGR